METRLKVCVEIMSSLSLGSRKEGDRIIGLWEECLPDYLPDKIGNCEPIRHQFDLSDRDAMLDHWNYPFLAKRRKPYMESCVFMRRGAEQQHATWTIDVNYKGLNVNHFIDFLKRASTLLEADFGCLTLLTENEIAQGRNNGTVRPLDKAATKFNFFIATHRIQKSIPDIYWATVFGAPFVSLFGKEKLLTVPAYKTEPLNSETILVQLTSDMSEMHKDPPLYNSLKQKVKEHLGRDAFFQVDQVGAGKVHESAARPGERIWGF